MGRYEYHPENRCEGDEYEHNHWLKTYPGMQGWPDEEGDWIDDDDWILQWIDDHTSKYGDKRFKLLQSRCNDYSSGFYKVKDSLGFYKMFTGWSYVKDNEGYFYLRSGKDEYYIKCDDVYATFKKIMELQDKFFESNSIQPMNYMIDPRSSRGYKILD